MNFWTNAYLSIGTLLVPACIAAWRIKKISQAFLPFILLVWCGLCSEVTGLLLILQNQPHMVVYNIFGLLESLLVLWQFSRWESWGHQPGRRWLYRSLALVFVLSWTWESFVMGPGIDYANSYFTAFYSLALVVLSIDRLAHQLVFYFDRRYRDPVFLICLGFTVYFLTSFITEFFWVYGLNLGSAFQLQVHTITNWINFIVNVIYAFGLLWVPTKFRYLLSWSSLEPRFSW